MTMEQRKMNILVVEDEPELGMLFQEVFEIMGHKVVGIETSSQGAIEAVRKLKPDMVIMDVNLKGEGTGIDVAEFISGHDPSMAICITSGYDEQTYEEELKRVGRYRFIMKPITFDMLEAVVAELS